MAGNFRFRNLRPGVYTVTVELTGFQEQAFSVRVNVGTTATVTADLELAGVAETVTVVSETPLIQQAEASFTTNFTDDLLQNVPLAREFTAVTNFAPGFADKGAFGAGGNQSEGTSVHRVGAATNGYRINGVDVNESDWGLTFVNPSIDTIAEVQIVSIGASAEYSDYTGAMINLVTKGGTNEFRGSGSYYFQNGDLRSDNAGGITDLQRGKFSYDHDFSLGIGGPIARNKLLFFASGAYQKQRYSNVADSIWEDGGISAEDGQQGNQRWRLHGRLDYLLNDSNTFGAMINHDPGGESNRDLRPGSPLQIAMDTDYSTTTWALTWQGQPGDNTFVDFRYGGYSGGFIRLPLVCCELPDYWYNGTRLITQGFLEDEKNARDELRVTVTQYVDDFLGATHDAKIGADYNDSWASWLGEYTGSGAMFTYGSYVYGSVYDIGLEAQIVRTGGFVQDDVSVSDRVNLNLGLRFDRTNGHDMIAGEAQDEIITQFNNWSPRFGANFDVSGDGRAVVHASWGRYFEKISQGHVSRATGSAFDVNSGFSPYQSYFFVIPEGMFGPGYDPFNPTDSQLLALQAAVFSPDNLTSDSSPSYPIDDNGLESLRTEAFNVGFEYEFTRDWVVGADYIRKKDTNMFVWDDRTPNVFTPFEYTSPVIPGFVDTPITQTLYSKPDGNLDNVQINDPYYWRKHDIVTLQINRRPSSGFNFSTSVTYQNNRGTIGNGDGESIWGRGEDQADNPNFNGHPFTGISPLQFSRKWSWKVLANYTLPGDILAGLYWNWASGRPWSISVRNTTIPEMRNTSYADIPIEPFNGRQWDDHKQLDLRLSKFFDVDNARFEVIADAFNVLNDFSPTGVDGQLGRNFSVAGTPTLGLPRTATGLLPGRQFRLGVRASF